ncbi:unnamed protein product [Danaus chrysippus]|uniref:(African queen) hypothetical protein n=1 Tax=Danaus chrysippus TaxID=151541 RepID=A0A8J2QI48_9NEOP|nr:unnamed protein product [Danaus chrysippus]
MFQDEGSTSSPPGGPSLESVGVCVLLNVRHMSDCNSIYKNSHGARGGLHTWIREGMDRWRGEGGDTMYTNMSYTVESVLQVKPDTSTPGDMFGEYDSLDN